MSRRNNQTNTIIKWVIIIGDFLVLNLLLLALQKYHPAVSSWIPAKKEVFWVVCNMAMILSQWKFCTIIHERIVSGGDILRRVITLNIVQIITAYLVMKAIDINLPVGWVLVHIGSIQIFTLIVVRLFERNIIKRIRQLGFNTRMVTFVGNDPELVALYERLSKNPTLGYRVKGFYADFGASAQNEESMEMAFGKKRLGTLHQLMESIKRNEILDLGDELYVCLSRREREKIQILSHYCDKHVIRFYFVPLSVELLDIHLKRELLDDMELFTTHEILLDNPVNKAIKRIFDIVTSCIILLCFIPLFPFVALIIHIQSPGPIFFRQKRTGINGCDFVCYKFRSMHVNNEADTIQATENDPRKFPFGDFMRKCNIDEMPQFWNVLKGDMSIVGPRPHMLYHTDLYRQLINDYMVRHFVKPGITGWAQVTGFRGETKELWQMEERVKRDIWYMEHWSVWLDLRIIWMTFKTIFIHDEQAY